VVGAGNNWPACTTLSSCNIANPADTIRAFAVNAFDADLTGCETDYNSCEIDHCFYRRGGMPATVDGVTYAGAVSGIALVGPNGVERYTTNVGFFGEVAHGFTFLGTSATAPHISGIAAAVKSKSLDAGTRGSTTRGMSTLSCLA